MEGKASRFAAGLSAALLLCVGAPAWSQDGVPIKGVIIRHQGSTIVVRGEGGDKTINLTGATKIRGSAGSLGVRTSERPASDLIRGLHVEVQGVTTGSGVEATRVDFRNSDLKTARSVAGGLVATDEQVAANAAGIAENSGRIDNIGLLEPAGRTKVYFAVGSSTLTEKSKQDLQAIAAQAKSMKGAYRLAVVGRADPTGNAKANQRLSEARAAAVTAYLMQTQGILPGNFLPAAALGDNPVAQDPDPPKNAAEARRVTVTIGVSKSNRTASTP
jgi:outer membrane protein OmpA-like peptidoglycan-associated protein